MSTEQRTLDEAAVEISELTVDELPSTIHDVRKMLPTVSDSDSHYHLPLNATTYRPNLHTNTPCGLVVCCRCGEGALNNDDIEHSDECEQADDHSAYYWINHRDEMLQWFQDHPDAARRWLARRREGDMKE